MSGFQLFSLPHILTMCLLLFLFLILFFFKDWFHSIRFLLGFLLLTAITAENVWKAQAGRWSFSSDLPLHLSDVAVILTAFMLFTKSRRLFQFLWFAGIASSVQAIAAPDLGPYPFPHLIFFTFFISHGAVILGCLLFAANHFKPDKKSLWITVGLINLYALAVYLLNLWLGSNYLYLMKKPEGGSLLNWLGPWPWYLLSMEGTMLVSFLLLYWPFRKRS
ncbi:TIGR02206 family membrane protein [Bacillus sp. FJAT-42376]|uniref:YwaF family protein n=1 Tax=Bacillus sp. FJAT-42376 TaxID=2014076 RepID=UPI000F4E0AA8|nr:TIGR02206 family membrane protein [Bacillus sp. FJAT-42376]AZB42491.1 TIGR02206 family membrane protein [Bacillus sp. FJAT-42376]